MIATDSALINVANTIPTNITSAISTNVTNTVSMNSDDKKVRYKMDFYIGWKIFWFITFHIKLRLVQNYCTLALMELDILYYLLLKNMTTFTIGLNIITQKSCIRHFFSHNYARIKIESSDFLPLEKNTDFALSCHNY